MEPIELSFVSKGASIPGLSEVLAGLERVDSLLTVLGRRQVVIDLKVTGAGQLQTTADSVQRLTELMRAAGDTRGAGLVGAGQLDMGEVSNRTQRLIAAKQAELLGVENAITEHHRRIQQLQNRFQFGSQAYNTEELKSRAGINAASTRRTELGTDLGLLQQTLGVAEALRGVKLGEGFAQGVHAATAAEAKLGVQAVETTSAMSAQMAVAQQKAKMMQELATAVNATATADKHQAQAARENAQANAQSAQSAGAMPQGLRKNAGWKLHLPVDEGNRDAMEKVLAEMGVSFKRGMSGGQAGKDFTVYAGAKDAASAIAKQINLQGAHLLGSPSQGVIAGSMPFGGSVYGRFDAAGNQAFHQYGAHGVPFFGEDMQKSLWDKANFNATSARARADAALKQQYGEFYTGAVPAQSASAASGGLGASHLLGTRRRYVRDDSGNLVLEGSQQKFRTGPGREVTVDGEGNETRVTDSIRARREQLAGVLSEYRQRRAGLEDHGQRAELERQLAQDMRAMHGAMGPLGGSEFGLGLLGKAGQAEERGRKFTLQAMQPPSGASDMDRLLQRAMQGSNDRDAAVQAERDRRASELRANRHAGRTLRDENAGMRAEFGGLDESFRKGAPFETRTAGGGRERKSKAQSSTWDGQHETVTHIERWDAAGNQLASTLERTNNALSHTGRGVTAVGESFMRNLYSVTTWSAAVGALYAGLGALKAGFAGAVHTDREMAYMASIFRGAPGEYKGLTSDILGIATQQGRSSEEALAAGMKFSHLGLTRGETGGFTKLAMTAANIAGPHLTGEEAAHTVASYSEAFGMGLGEATVALDQLNAVANRSNTTIGELLETMGRTGAIAKTTGFGFTEYASLLAGGAGHTGRPVSEFAQSMGMMLTNLSDPDKAREMKARYGIDLFGANGVSKGGPQIVREIQGRYAEMSPDAGLGMLSFMSGGRRNAQRLAAIFDNYDESTVRNVQSQRDLNSASDENNRILDTTQAKLTGLASAWKNVWHNAFQEGGLKTVTNGTLGAASGLLGAADTGIGGLMALGGDLLTLAPRKLAWAATGMVGPSPESKFSHFIKGRVMGEDAQWVQGRATANMVGYNQSLGLANAEAQGMEAFSSMSNQLSGGVGAEEARKLIGNMVRLYGGDEDTRREWQSEYETQGRGGFSGTLAGRYDEMKARAEVARKKASHKKYEANFNFGVYLRGIDEDIRVENDSERKAALKLFRNDIEEQQVGMNRDSRKGMDEREVEPPSTQGAQNMRERVRYTMQGMEWFSGASGFNSPYEKDKLRWQREELGWRGGFADHLSSEGSKRTLMASMMGPAGLMLGREGTAYEDQARTIRAADVQTDLMLKYREPEVARRDAQFDAGLDVRRHLSAFGAGLTPTRQIADFLSGAGGEMNRIKGMPDIERRGAEEAMLNVTLQRRNELMEREFSLAREIKQTRMEEQKQASRNLLMGSAGDQLAASGLQAFLQSRGGKRMSESEFGVLDPSTKQQIMSTVPGLAPASLSRAGDLEREQGDLGQNKDAMGGQFAKMLDALRSAPAAVMNFAPTVNLGFGDQFNAAMLGVRELVEAKLGDAIKQMRQDNAAFRAGNADVGADAMVGAQQ